MQTSYKQNRALAWCANISRVFAWTLLASTIILAGCNTTNRTNNQPLLVGPSPAVPNAANDQQGPTELVNAEIFLDVAIPAFDPGFPLDNFGEIDGDELEEQGIWPQLRRTEAKIFAADMKAALDDKKVFGTVSVVPDASTPSDLFVLGEIGKSDSEEVEITITVADSTGEIWGKESFEHTVSQGFMRDQRNQGKNPYEPVFKRASDYVVSLLSKLSIDEKTYIKNMSLMRYARYYSPESYDDFINTDLKRKNGQRYYKFELTKLPDPNDPMLKRIEDLRAQELLFVDRLQDNYEVFQAETREAYGTWQEETLPEVIAARKAKTERNTKAVVGGIAAILAAILIAKSAEKDDRPSDQKALEIGAVAAGIGSIWAINESFKNNSRLKVHSAVIEEQGQALDLSVSPTVIDFENQTIELQGTAQEQYLQWKTHLRKMFNEEDTPDVQL
ncbi:hypothetical protein [Glaciecola petra]|uniref:Lipoprotein n=1 Tax=Glaciecola petra TaxID=3075602 RepID=A0ABU2ZSW1_9ALTE|nr:hypothetical protein [Aestuariibacter sp. P117]MDT0595726.1 hypothetical protein [Aestuariibacter sp. P117]